MPAPGEKPKEQPPQNPPAVPLPKFWLYYDKQTHGPYSVRFLQKIKEFNPDILAAREGSKSQEDWLPAKDYPELQDALAQKANPKPKAPPPSKPDKKSSKKPPLQPLPDEPNYLLRVLGLLVLAGAGVIGFQSWKKAPEEKAPAAPQEKTHIAPLEQMWPEANAPQERLLNESQLLQFYFPMLLSRQGVNQKQLPAVCEAAAAFVPAYENYKNQYSENQLGAFSQRISISMMSDERPAPLRRLLDQAEKQGIDLSPLKNPGILRQNMSSSSFSIQQALENAQFLLNSFCKPPSIESGQ